MIYRQAPITSIVALPGDYFILGLDSPEQACPALPGQFFMLGMPQGGLRYDPLLNRPLSVLDVRPGPAGDPGEILFLVKQAGRGTRLLSALRVGEKIACHGPLGTPFPEPPPSIPVMLVGGGVGIAPLYFFACSGNRFFPDPVKHSHGSDDGGWGADHPASEESLPRPRTVFFYGGRSGRDLPLRSHLEGLAEIDVVLTTEDGSVGRPGLVTAPLEECLNRNSSASIYCCGPNAMMRVVTRLAKERQMRVWVSLENRMGCGMGVCLGCAVPMEEGTGTVMRRVCRDGPVVDGYGVRWDLIE